MERLKLPIINLKEVYLRLAYKYFYIGGFLILLMACNENKQKEDVVAFSNGKLIADTGIKYAKRFSIANTANSKVLFLYGKKDSQDTTACFVLYKGKEAPELNFKNTYVIKVPVNNIACMSSVYVAMLHKLQCKDKIIAIESADYYNDNFIVEQVAAGKIKELSKGPEINVEQTLLLKPGLLFTYGMGNPATDINEKIIKSKIPVAVSLDHLEEHPLARAEWIKFLAAFFDKQQLADSLFKTTESNYNLLKAVTDTIKRKPSVLTEIKYADAWYVPGGKSFMAHLLKDAGSNYVWSDDSKSGSLPLTFEEVYTKAGSADYWVNLFININSKKELLAFDERYALFNAYKQDKLYNNNAIANKNGYSDYWEEGMVNPDELLKDLIKIFHPQLLQQHQLKYYKKIK